MAEETGFEPARGCPQHTFQACALNHSATPPRGLETYRELVDISTLNSVPTYQAASGRVALGAGADKLFCSG